MHSPLLEKYSFYYPKTKTILFNSQTFLAQLAGAAEYTDGISAEG